MKFTNLTGVLDIGANCYLLEAAGKRLMLDTGAHPKREGTDSLPRLELVADGSLDAIVMSHAHQDHIGSLPAAMRRHPDAPVLMTEATKHIGETMLHNSVNVMLAEKNERDVPGLPLFTHREIDLPNEICAAAFASGTPMALLTKGTVREARGFASSTKSFPSSIAN